MKHLSNWELVSPPTSDLPFSYSTVENKKMIQPPHDSTGEIKSKGS